MTSWRLFALSMAVLLATIRDVDAQRLNFDHRLLRRTQDSMSISLVRNGSPVLVGELWDAFADVRAAKGPALRRMYRTRNEAFGAHAETTLVRPTDLTLLFRRTYSRSTSDSVVASQDSIRGWRDNGQGSRVTILRAIEPRAIESSFFDALIRAAPLAPDYVVQVRAYLSVHDSVVTLGARVTGSDSVRQRDGTRREAWVVEMDFAGLSSTLWIDKANRALVRQVIRLTPSVHMLMQR